MGNFSRDTFDKLKHYVGVRLQQGVPIVDADWNELEDIRKYELQAFLKWFVGNGVPAGNDGFHILPAAGDNDVVIQAGRCLVEGWDVINEQNLNYRQQRLFNEARLNEAWNVAPLPALTEPPATTPAGVRTDTVYLDVWEREVNAANAAEDFDRLVNPAIGIETCVRLKREWVVRVAEGLNDPPAAPPNHVFYVLAQLNRAANTAVIAAEQIVDRRHTGLTIISQHDIDQIVKDAYGSNYTLGHRGLPQLGISLRDAVNAAMWGRLPATPEYTIDTVNLSILQWLINSVNIIPSQERPLSDAMLIWTRRTQLDGKPHVMTAKVSFVDGTQPPQRLTNDNTAREGESIALQDGEKTWVFWISDRKNPGRHEWHVYSGYHTPSQGWRLLIDEPLGEVLEPPSITTDWSQDMSNHMSSYLSAFRHSQGGIWLLWVHKDGLLRLRRYSSGNWSPEQRVSNAVTSGSSRINGENAPMAIEWNNSVALFWEAAAPDLPKIWYRLYNPGTGGAWQATNPARRLTAESSYSEELPRAFRDGAGSLWLFWRSLRQSGPASSDYYIYAMKDFDTIYDLKVLSTQVIPVLFDDHDKHFSVFLSRKRENQIWYKNYDTLNNQWSSCLDMPGGEIVSLFGGCPDEAGGEWLVYLKSVTGNQTRLVVRKVYSRL